MQPVVSEGAINPPGQWDFFLSYTQRDNRAVALVEMLSSSLKNMDKTVWLDVQMNKRAWAGWNLHYMYYIDTFVYQIH